MLDNPNTSQQPEQIKRMRIERRIAILTMLTTFAAGASQADSQAASLQSEVRGGEQSGAPVAADQVVNAQPWYAAVSLHAFIDTYYAWNDNAPVSHENFVPGSGTTAKRADELNINLAAVDLVIDPKPVGLHLALVAGNGAEVVHSGEPPGSAVGKEAYRYLYQATLSYNAPVGSGLLIEAGVYPSHIGFESFYSKDNWNYTRSWLGEFSPYYQTGVKGSYAISTHWSAQLHLLNGWQIIGENNNARSVGTQIAYAGDRLSASFNTFAGAELPNDDTHLRTLGDLNAIWKATPRLSLGGSLDRGRQELPLHDAANWLGIAAYARVRFGDRHALALRGERFKDPDDGISGSAQTLTEMTLTHEFRPAEHLILKMEGRRDHSTTDVFARRAGPASRTQTIVVLGAVATF